MNTEATLSESIRAVLRITGEGQGVLAEVIGITYDGVNRRLNGRGRWTFAELDKVALHWGISPLYLLGDPVEAQRQIMIANGAKMPRQPSRSAA